jgi:hypothetical protein
LPLPKPPVISSKSSVTSVAASELMPAPAATAAADLDANEEEDADEDEDENAEQDDEETAYRAAVAGAEAEPPTARDPVKGAAPAPPLTAATPASAVSTSSS